MDRWGKRVGRAGLVALATTLAACSEGDKGTVGPNLPLAPAVASGDSASGAAEALQTQQAAVITISAGEFARVTIASASTARCETVGVSGAININDIFPLGTGGCGGGESDNVGQIEVIGPAAADGTLDFFISSSPSSQSMTSGTFPTFTVMMDDGIFDNDFDDVVLSVTVFQLTEGCPPDAIFQDAAARDALRTVWGSSNPGAPDIANRTEQGAFLFDTGAGFEVTPVIPEFADACQITLGPQTVDVATLLGFAHTHTIAKGEFLPPRVCARHPKGGTGSAPGPSKGDVQSAGSQDQQTGGNRTYYTIEPEGIFRYTVRVRPQDGKFEFDTLEQFVGCDGIGGA